MKRHGTFFQLHYHFVWATRNRLPIITPSVEAKLYAYFSTKCLELDYRLHAVGGTEHSINHVSGLGDMLYWQDGYGVITLRKDEAPKVTNYIRNQKQHHASGTLSKLLERIETED